MFRVAIVLITVLSLSKTKNIDSNKCYDPKQEFYPYFGTRTAYKFVGGNISRPNAEYEPLQIWMVSRHGVRYPAANHMKRMLDMSVIRDQIVKNHEQGAGELCANDLEKLRQWHFDSTFTTEFADTVPAQGRKDLQMLAQRLRQSFPELLKSNNASEYLFSSTTRPSAVQSQQIFATKLFGSNMGLNFHGSNSNNSKPIPNIFFRECPFLVENFLPESVYFERDKFLIGPKIQQLIKDFNRRLGYSNTLDFGNIRLIYDVCRHETAWNSNNKQSIWCTLFTKNELIAMEYSEDLDHYYCCGPGNTMNPKLSCPIVRSMFEHFQNIVNGKFENEPKAVMIFSHTVNFQSLLTVLHIGQKSSPLLASGFKLTRNPEYSISLMGPLNANLVAVLYRCNSCDFQYKVIFYLNENAVEMDGCDGSICDWQFLKRKLGSKVESCTIEFCYEGSSESDRRSTSTEQYIDTTFDRFNIFNKSKT